MEAGGKALGTMQAYLVNICIFWTAAFGSAHATGGAEADSIAFHVHDDSYVSYTAPVRIALVAGSTVEGVNREVTGEIVWTTSESGTRIATTLTVDAGAFDSDHSRRDRDVREILNADEHPEITFSLTSLLGIGSETPEELSGDYVAAGVLTVNGVDAQVSVPVNIRYESGRLIVEGSTAARYTDFDIDPPRVGAFISRAPDELRLHVHIIAEKTHGRQDQGNH